MKTPLVKRFIARLILNTLHLLGIACLLGIIVALIAAGVAEIVRNAREDLPTLLGVTLGSILLAGVVDWCEKWMR